MIFGANIQISRLLQITEPVAQFSDLMRSFFDCDTIPPEPNIFSPGFLPDRTNKYIVKSHSNEFNNNQRSQVVWSILNRTRYKNECPEKVGIQRLIAKQVRLIPFYTSVTFVLKSRHLPSNNLCRGL